MSTSRTTRPAGNEVAIFERLFANGKGEVSLSLARYLLTLGFGEDDQARMHELARRNQSGLLSAAELEELQGYAKAGCLLGILQSKVRKALKRAGRNRLERSPN